MNSAVNLDLGPFSWVKDEIDQALRRAESEVRGGQNFALAARYLHQAHGALAVVGLDGVTTYSEALEKLLADGVADPSCWTPQRSSALLHGIATLRGYLDSLMAGGANQPLRLFAAYQSLFAARQQPLPMASELFFPNLNQLPPPRASSRAPLPPESLALRIKAARLGFERGMLKWLKHDLTGLREMRSAVAIIEQAQTLPAPRVFWWCALALFDVLGEGGVEIDAEVHRLCRRVDAQIRKLLDGSEAVGDRLLRDVLYWVAVSRIETAQIAAVRQTFALADLLPSQNLLQDGVLGHQARLGDIQETLVHVEENWTHFSAGNTGNEAALRSFHTSSTRLLELVHPLELGGLTELLSMVADIASQLSKNLLPLGEALTQEVATSLLLAESVIEDFSGESRPNADLLDLCTVMTARLRMVLQGDKPNALVVPELEALQRRAEEMRTLGQVSRGLLNNLARIEQSLDSYFRDPAQQFLLRGLATPLAQVEIGLIMLGEQRAVEVLRDCMRQIEGFARSNSHPDPAAFQPLAKQLSGLGLFIERLRFGAPDIDSLLTPEVPTAEPKRPASVEEELAKRAEMTQTMVALLRQASTDPASLEQLKGYLIVLRDDALITGDMALEHRAGEALDAIDAGRTAAELAELFPDFLSVASPVVVTTAAAAPSDDMLAIFVEEAQEVVAEIGHDLARLHDDPSDRKVRAGLRRGFHTLKGSSLMVGLVSFGNAAFGVEQVLNRWIRHDYATTADLFSLLEQARRLFSDWVGQLAAGAEAGLDIAPLLAACAALEPDLSKLPETADALSDSDTSAKVTELSNSLPGDDDILTAFFSEADELLAQLGEEMRAWREQPDASNKPLQRLLHTFKGSARMAGAETVGDLLHEMESRIAAAPVPVPAALIDSLEADGDRVSALLQAQRNDVLGMGDIASFLPAADAGNAHAGVVGAGQAAQLKVRADVVDRLVHDAGETTLSRKRIEVELQSIKQAMTVLDDHVMALQQDVGEVQLEADRQMPVVSRNGENVFDPLELDRYGPLQEKARQLSERLGELADIRLSLLRHLDSAQLALQAQSRAQREMSRLLMNIRMAPFSSIAERLYRVVRQSSRELGREAHLQIDGGDIELDRSVLEKIVAPLEHILRNAVAHGLETPEQRIAMGKPALGEVHLGLAQEGNEVVLSIADDGQGLDIHRILKTAQDKGLNDDVLSAYSEFSGVEKRADGRNSQLNGLLSRLIFLPGFSTSAGLTQLAGRGVGLDAVRNQVADLGGKIEVSSSTGKGCCFTITLPLTLVVTQVLLVKAGGQTYAIPATLVEQAAEYRGDAMAELRRAGQAEWLGQGHSLRYLPRLLGASEAKPRAQERHWLIFLKGGNRRIALEVDDLIGNQEAVVKNIGPQLSRVPGISGATVLADGDVVLILSPLALADRRAKPLLPLTENATASGSPHSVNDHADSAHEAAGRLDGQDGQDEYGSQAQSITAGLRRLAADLPPAASRPVSATTAAAASYPGWPAPANDSGAEESADEDADDQPYARFTNDLEMENDIPVLNDALDMSPLAGWGRDFPIPDDLSLDLPTGPTYPDANDDEQLPLLTNRVDLPPSSPPAPAVPTADVMQAVPYILVVDDSMTVRKITARLLERAGYRVEMARDGEDALALMQDQPPALVLADIEMPRMDGFEMVQAMRQTPALAALPVLMITSRTADKHLDQAYALGVLRVLGKPYDEDELLALTGQLMPANATNSASR